MCAGSEIWHPMCKEAARLERRLRVSFPPLPPPHSLFFLLPSSSRPTLTLLFSSPSSSSLLLSCSSSSTPLLLYPFPFFSPPFLSPITPSSLLPLLFFSSSLPSSSSPLISSLPSAFPFSPTLLLSPSPPPPLCFHGYRNVHSDECLCPQLRRNSETASLSPPGCSSLLGSPRHLIHVS